MSSAPSPVAGPFLTGAPLLPPSQPCVAGNRTPLLPGSRLTPQLHSVSTFKLPGDASGNPCHTLPLEPQGSRSLQIPFSPGWRPTALPSLVTLPSPGNPPGPWPSQMQAAKMGGSSLGWGVPIAWGLPLHPAFRDPVPLSTSGPGFSLRMQILISQTFFPKHISSPASGPVPSHFLFVCPHTFKVQDPSPSC